MRASSRVPLAVVGATMLALAAGPAATVASATPPGPPDDDPPDALGALAGSATWESPLERGERAEVPEDRYALAGGCYTLASVGAGAEVIRAGDGFAAAGAPGHGEPFHLQATDLGRYLLLAAQEDLLAVDDGLVGEILDDVADQPLAAVVSGISRGTADDVAEELRTGPLGEATGRGGGIGGSEEASELADWQLEEVGDDFRLSLPVLDGVLAVDGDGELLLADPDEAGDDARWAFALADGCAAWPEIEVNVDGPPVGGETPYGPTRGYLDAHLHMMAFEFLGGRARCGQPWHPYGVAHALDGCKEHELADGRGHLLEFALTGNVDPVEGHDTTAGWPTFTDWPRHDLLTYEQVYYRWLERSWRGGLRMFTNLLVDNYVLCEVYPYTHNSCNEMDGVLLQAERVRALERYIDAQHGGPGQGWLRVVTDPFEARRVINDGRLAVVLGMEVSRPFDCRLFFGVPQCDTDEIDAWIDELYDLGVRQMELVNKFDNALTGVAGDPGETGLIVNTGNVIETGRFWRMETCDEDDQDHGHGDHHHEGEAHDRRQYNLHDESGAPDELTGRDALAGMILQEAGQTGAAPIYGEGPHCNVQGLTGLGEHVLERMMERGMIFDPDHMSARARHEALDIIQESGYSGVVSSHSWADDVVYQRVYESGGVVTPMAGSSTGFAGAWDQHREWADDRFHFGFGFGSDVNGFASQGSPRDPGEADEAVTYPFEGLGGVSIDRQVSGERTYDVNVDGVAHYGLYPDWVEDLRLLAGDEIVADLEQGPEAYLQMWERAVGVAPDACRDDVEGLTRERVRELERGIGPEQVLAILGQPTDRDGGVFTYCLDDGRTARAHFDDEGRLHRVSFQGGGGGPDGAGSGPGERPPGQQTRVAGEGDMAEADTEADHEHDERRERHAATHAASSHGAPPAAGWWVGMLGAAALAGLALQRQPRPAAGRRWRG